MATRTITGLVHHASGAVWVGATVTFEMEAGTFTISPDVTFLRDGATAVTNSSGAFTVTLTSGLDVYWRCSLPDGDGFRFALADGTATTIEALRSASEGLPVPIYTGVEILITNPAIDDILIHNGTQFVNRPNDRFLNVKTYGALGDGVADDTVAIQAAFDAVDTLGGVVFFPQGTYLTTAQINIYGPNVIMRGDGPSTIIKAKNNANITIMFVVQATATNFTAEAFVLDGNRDNLGTSGSYADCRGITTANVGLLFRDIEVKNVNSQGISVQAATNFIDVNAVFERCWIHHNGMLTAKEGNDVFLFNVSNVRFTDCLFEHGYGTGGSGQYAGGGVVGSATQLRFVNCIFRDNFNGGGQTGGIAYADVDDRWEYLGCTFELTEADPHATCAIEMAMRNLIVDGCEFYNHNTVGVAAISIHGNEERVGEAVGRVIITNNVFFNNYGCIGHMPTGDIAVVIIANNRFEAAEIGVGLVPSGGAFAPNDADKIIIIGNDFTDDVTTPIDDGGATNLIVLANLPTTIGNTLPGNLTITGGTTTAVNNNLVVTKEGPETVTIRSGAAGSVTDFTLGRAATEGRFAVANEADAFSTGAAAGDLVIRTETKKVLINTNAGGAPAVTVSTANVVDFGSAISVPDGITAPGTVSGKTYIYVDTADGDLKVKFGDGTVKVLAADT